MVMFGTGIKPRRFEYKPRHYDPQAEEREARRRMILGSEYEEGKYVPGMYIRERRILRMQERERVRRDQSRRTWMRSAIFLILALGVIYFMFVYLGKYLS